MTQPSEYPDREALRERIIGLGERSVHKSYYPELLDRMKDLERFRALLDQSHDAIYLIDAATGAVVDASRSAWEKTGFTKAAVFTSSFLDLIAPAERARFSAIVDKSLEEHRMPGPVITSLMAAFGDPIPVEITLKLVHFSGKVYAVAVARDITERRKAERELRIKGSAVESSTDGIVILDLDGRIIYANRAAGQIFGCASPTLMNDLDIGCFLTDSEAALRLVRNLNAGPSLHAVVSGRNRSGAVFDLQISGSQVRDENGRLLCLMMICRDVSDMKAVEEMKRRAYEQLEQNIEQFAVLGDRIRNSLQAIVGIAAMMDDPGGEAILRLSYQIDEIVTHLDRGWVDSESVRQFLRRRENLER